MSGKFKVKFDSLSEYNELKIIGMTANIRVFLGVGNYKEALKVADELKSFIRFLKKEAK